MTSRERLPEGPYGHIRTMADLRVQDFERRAADRHEPAEYRTHAKILRQHWRDHVATQQENGRPCNACGQPWPCDSIAGIFASM